MSEQRVHNPKAVEIVYDSAGHICTGHMSVMADLSDPVTARLVDTQRLFVPAKPKRGSDPDAADHLIVDEPAPTEPPAEALEPEPVTEPTVTTSTTSTRRITSTQNKSGETS